LEEKLAVISAACLEYDGSAAEAALVKLREKAWSARTLGLLASVSEKLLHSDFDEIVEEISEFM